MKPGIRDMALLVTHDDQGEGTPGCQKYEMKRSKQACGLSSHPGTPGCTAGPSSPAGPPARGAKAGPNQASRSRIAAADAQHAPVNSTDAFTASGTAARVTVSNPNLGK